MNKNESRIMKMGLWVSLPINLQLLLTSSERDVFNTLRHFDNTGVRFVSRTMLRLYTCLSEKTIKTTLRNLETLGVVKKGKVCNDGTHYYLFYEKLGSALKKLNNERNPVKRLRLADEFRGELAENTNLIKEFENTEFDTKQ